MRASNQLQLEVDSLHQVWHGYWFLHHSLGFRATCYDEASALLAEILRPMGWTTWVFIEIPLWTATSSIPATGELILERLLGYTLEGRARKVYP
eukprot:240580-Pelagomonas_calceolata.AAC.1